VEVSDLTPEELEALLRLLDPDRERAGERYEELRRQLVRLFGFWGNEEPEELADETLNRMAHKAAEGVPVTDAFRYARGIANHVQKEHWRRVVSRDKALEAGEWPPRPYEEEPEDRRLAGLRQCLDQLPADQRALLLRYHQGDHHKQNRKALCEELGIEMNALRIRIHRLRRRVETCVEERLRTTSP
jgi:DNA-directed RNA polymerase specialized sigma24 family protein